MWLRSSPFLRHPPPLNPISLPLPSLLRRPFCHRTFQSYMPSTANPNFRLQTVHRHFHRSEMSPSATDKAHAIEAGHQKKDVEGAENEWKYQPPYRIHEPSENFKAVYEASCHCGRVKYQLSREKPLDAKFCHCGTCQVLHGAPFQWAAIFHKDDINFTRGYQDLTWYESAEKVTEHKLPCKISCSYCRTPILDEGRNMILLFPTLIRFKNDEERKNFAPTCHIFYNRRVVDINDGLPKWTGINGQSDLIEDSPPELVKKRKREAETDPAGKGGPSGGEGRGEKEDKGEPHEAKSG